MVEFALVAPLFFSVFFGLIIAAIVVMNQVQLTNAARDAARAAAVCGSSLARSNEGSGTPIAQYGAAPLLPDGDACTETNLRAYTIKNLNAVGGISSPNVCLGYSNSFSTCTLSATALDSCQAGDIITVAVQYNQPLYVPLVGYVFGNGGSNTRTLQGVGQATCEQ